MTKYAAIVTYDEDANCWYVALVTDQASNAIVRTPSETRTVNFDLDAEDSIIGFEIV